MLSAFWEHEREKLKREHTAASFLVSIQDVSVFTSAFIGAGGVYAEVITAMLNYTAHMGNWKKKVRGY